jgi:DNA polymerase-1
MSNSCLLRIFEITFVGKLVFECTEAQAEEVKEIVKEEMEKAGSLFLTDLPCIAEVTISDMWEK